MGVPHVLAATSVAVMYGLGYATAQDRLAQLELASTAALKVASRKCWDPPRCDETLPDEIERYRVLS